MSRLHVVRADQALHAIDFILGWTGGWQRVELVNGDPLDNGFWHRTGTPRSGAELADLVRFHDERADTEIRLGVPWLRPSSEGVSFCTALWVVVDGPDQLNRAARFRPLPTMVLKTGRSRRWLLWGLERRVGWVEASEANRKLAYHLRAVQKHGEPDRAWFPAPGSCLRVDRVRPAPVVVTRLEPVFFQPSEIVGRLREPPARDAWLQGVAVR